MLAATHEQAVLNRFARHTPAGKRIWRSLYFGPSPSPSDASSLTPGLSKVSYTDPVPGEKRPPQAFLIQQEAGATVQPHFHFVDQFQVVAAGDGLLGRHAVAPLSVHFSAACTGYGPIEPGDQGLSYFTFRASADQTGAQYLPQARDLMRDGKRRNIIVEQIPVSSDAELTARSETDVDLYRDDPDGLAVLIYRIAPGGHITCLDPSAGQGITLLVAAGNVMIDGQTFARWSCAFLDPDEAGVKLTAGSSGAEILALRYPVKTATA